MKAFLFLLAMVCSVVGCGQDVIVYITGYCSEEAIPLDSIIIENLTQPDTLVLDTLPQEITTYEINLSTGKLINGLEPSLAQTGISLIINMPGYQQVEVVSGKNERLNFSLYSVEGKPVMQRDLTCSTGSNLIDIVTGTGSLYLLVIQGKTSFASFKLLGGANENQQFGISLREHSYITRSASLTLGYLSDGFTFSPGDHVRITAKKAGRYPNTLRRFPADQDSIDVLLSKPCPGIAAVTYYDGNVYQTVQIGEQCWLRENIKSKHYSDGSPLVDGTGLGNWEGQGEIKYWFDYNDEPANSEVYGRLYSGGAAMNGVSPVVGDTNNIQGICPDGWHMPGNQEWFTLERYLGMPENMLWMPDFRGTDEGNQIKEADDYHWYWWFPQGTNTSGYTALGSGIKYYNGSFDNLTSISGFWVATAQKDWYPGNLTTRTVAAYESRICNNPNQRKDYGLSCRCIKD